MIAYIKNKLNEYFEKKAEKYVEELKTTMDESIRNHIKSIVEEKTKWLHSYYDFMTNDEMKKIWMEYAKQMVHNTVKDLRKCHFEYNEFKITEYFKESFAEHIKELFVVDINIKKKPLTPKK